MNKLKQGFLVGFNETEEVGYCEDLGSEAEALREGGRLACEFTPELVAAILDAQTVLNLRREIGSNHFKSIYLCADGLFYDDTFLGEFRVECATLIVWPEEGITLRLHHKHNYNAELSFNVEGF